jgi:predicted DNA-binding transcriptional regulator AlpA
VPSEIPAAETILLTLRQAAGLLGLGERTLWRHSRSGLAPGPVKIGGAVRYRRAELVAWIEAGCPRTDGGNRL